MILVYDCMVNGIKSLKIFTKFNFMKGCAFIFLDTTDGLRYDTKVLNSLIIGFV